MSTAPTAAPAAQQGRDEHEDAEQFVPQPPKKGLAATVADVTSHGGTYTFLVITSLIWMIPTAGLLVASLRTSEANAGSGWWTVFSDLSQLSLKPYTDLLTNPDILRSLWNTLLITVPATIGVVVIAATAAYAFTFVRWKGRDLTFLVVIGLLVVPLQVGLIPIASLYGTFGIYGSVLGVVLYHVAFGLPFAIFLMRNFFAGIPEELLEAARLDGAGELRLFRKVVLPLGLPAIASLTIFQFLWTWNDLLIALVFADSGSAPITVAIQQQTRQFGTNISTIAPGAFISMVVPLAVFFAFQKYFVKGLLAGSGK